MVCRSSSALTSGLVGGVGRDAAYIADHIRHNWEILETPRADPIRHPIAVFSKWI